MITGTSTITRGRYFFTALAWRCTPVGGPLGVRGAHPPPVGPRRPRELPPHVPIDTREKPDKVRHDRRHFHQLVLHLRHRSESRGRRRHFHQLFRQLRLLERGTLQDRVLKNLGHFDDLLDVRQRLVEDLHTTESTVCVPGTWSSWTTGTISTICSTMRRGTCSCGPDTAGSRSGRVPLTAGGSSSSREKCCTPAVWRVGSTGAWPCTSSHWTTLSRASTHPQRILLPRQALVKNLSKPEVHKTHNLGLPNSRNREIPNSPNHEISNCRNLNSRTPKVPKSRGRQKRTPTAPQPPETKFQKVGGFESAKSKCSNIRRKIYRNGTRQHGRDRKENSFDFYRITCLEFQVRVLRIDKCSSNQIPRTMFFNPVQLRRKRENSFWTRELHCI